MIEIIGKATSAKVFADDIEPYAQAQIQLLCDHPSFSGSKMRIMPDVHPGKVGTIGFTATVGPSLMPNVVGIDIGCGMLMAKLKDKRIEYAQLDAVIRDCVPAGFRIRGKAHPLAEQFDVNCLRAASHVKADKAALSLGTLGGGNHFIEVDKGEDGLYVIIHTGSRRLGKEITEYYLSEGQRVLKEQGEDVPYEMTALDGDLLADYLQLLDSRRTIHVAGYEQRSVTLVFKFEGKFCGVRCFTATLQTAHHNYGRRMVCNCKPCLVAAHKFCEFFINYFDYHLTRCKALHYIGTDGALCHFFSELLGNLVVYVCFKQRKPYLAHSLLNVGFCKFAFST